MDTPSARRSAYDQRNPLRILAVVLVLSTCAMLFLLWTIFTKNQGDQQQQAQLLEMQEVRGDIIYYSTLMTGAARMAMLTKDEMWRNQYDVYWEDMEAAFNKLHEVAPTLLADVAEKINSANDRLLDLQTSAFLLLSAGYPTEGLDLLIGYEYQQYQSVFQESLERIDAELAGVIQAAQTAAELDLITRLSIVAGMMALVFVAWWGSWFTLRRWGRAMRNSNIEREKMLERLATLNAVNAKSKARFEAVIQASADGLLTLNDAGDITTANVAAQRLFQADESDLQTENIFNLIPEMKMILDGGAFSISAFVEQVEGDRCEFLLVQHLPVIDGEMTEDALAETGVPIEVLIGKTGMAGDDSYMMTIRDLTLYKAAEAAEREKDIAQRESDAKTEFLANMSHEIRTPMNGVIGMTDLLLRTSMTPEQEDYARTIRKSADALQSVINDVLDFSKIDQGALSLEPISFNLHHVIDDVGDVFATAAESKGLSLIVRYAPNAPEHVVGDPGRIRQVLNNLVNNAIKFTADGYVLIEVEEIDSSEFSSILRFSVQDTGVGIKQEAQAKIFDRFTQEDESTTRRFGGTGLGLAICKQLVGLMEGRIGLESKQGEGSTFWFELPLEIDHETMRMVNERHSHANLSGLKVLVVEDNMINGQIFSENLAHFGVEYKLVRTAEAGLDFLKTHTFDVALIDHKLPGMNGIDFPRHVKALNLEKAPHLIFCSSLTFGTKTADLAQQGWEGYLTKPLKTHVLYHMLAAVTYREGLDGVGTLITPHTLRQSQTLPMEEVALTHTLEILVAEDDAVNQKVVSNLIKTLGCTVHLASEGKEAFALFKQYHFDLVLMDMQMPEMDGVTAAEHIRAYEEDEGRQPTPIIAFTANATEEDRTRCYYAGMNDFMTKPVSMEKFQQCLQKWVYHVQENLEKDAVAKSEAEDGAEAEDFAEAKVDAPIDFTALKETVPDKEFQEELLHLFMEGAEASLEILRGSDDTLWPKAAHKLKGSCINLGVAHLAELGSKAEVAQTDDIQSLFLPLMEEEYAKVKACIQAYLDA